MAVGLFAVMLAPVIFYLFHRGIDGLVWIWRNLEYFVIGLWCVSVALETASAYLG